MTETERSRKAVDLVKNARGKLEVVSKISVATLDELSTAYTPGIAAPTRMVHENPLLQYEFTAKATMTAVVTDGTAVLGLGDVGPEAAHVVMEGKGAMLKHYAGADPVPLCLKTRDPDEIIRVIQLVEPSFGFVFLEDIAAPNCFYIEEKLNSLLSIPVFHDDQHGTAIAVCGGLLNVLRITRRDLATVRIVICGAGASGLGTANLLMDLGAGHITVCDSKGALLPEESSRMNPYKAAVARKTNPEGAKNLTEAMVKADVFIGLSKAGLVSQEMVRSMAPEATVFSLANPDPEIMPPLALAAGARFVGTGRFDFPNAVNNLLAFPGIVKGARDACAKHITKEMKLAAVKAVSLYVPDSALHDGNLLPNPLDPGLSEAVAGAVASAWREGGS